MKDLIIPTIKAGDTLIIEPLDNLPNFDRVIKVDYVGDDYFAYGATETSDSKCYPFWAIKEIKECRRINYANHN